jgi:hypothetical protein
MTGKDRNHRQAGILWFMNVKDFKVIGIFQEGKIMGPGSSLLIA